MLDDAISNFALSELGKFGAYYSQFNRSPEPREICRFVIENKRKVAPTLVKHIEKELSPTDFSSLNKKVSRLSGKPSPNPITMLENLSTSIIQQRNNGDSPSFARQKRRKLRVGRERRLRDYQKECVEKILADLNTGGTSQLLVLPTGAGKTRTAMEAIRRWIDSSEEPLHVLWGVHSKELCFQAEQQFEAIWIDRRDVQFHYELWINVAYSSGITPRKQLYQGGEPSFTIATPDSTDLWVDDPPVEFDLIVVDEAHHGVEEQQNRFFKMDHNNRLGLTATPSLATSRRIFNKIYDGSLVYPHIYAQTKSTDQELLKKRLTSDGILSDFQVCTRFMTNEISAIGKRSDGSEGWEGQIPVIEVIRKFSEDMFQNGTSKLLIFCSKDIEFCDVVASVLRDSGFTAETIHSKVSNIDRRGRISAFNDGEIQILVSIDVLREGVDLPCVDGIILARKGLEASHPMFTQMIGRGLRGVESGGTTKCNIIHLK